VLLIAHEFKESALRSHRAQNAAASTASRPASVTTASGWQLREVHHDSEGAKEFGSRKSFPFDLANVLPWWNRAHEMDDAEEPNSSVSD
jgi:hypothetical protein